MYGNVHQVVRFFASLVRMERNDRSGADGRDGNGGGGGLEGRKRAWYDVPRPFLSGERNNHDGVRHTGRNAAKCLSAHTNRPLASPLSTVPLSTVPLS